MRYLTCFTGLDSDLWLLCACVLSHFSHAWLFATPWTVAHQAFLSMEFSRQEYWSGLSWPLTGNLSDPGIEPASLVTPVLQVDSLLLTHRGSPLWLLWKWKSALSNSLRPHRLYRPWNSPGQNTGEGSLSLLQGIFPTQGSNPDLPHCRWILYQLSYHVTARAL